MRRLLFTMGFILPLSVYAQYLSNLKATKNNPLYTIYAASLGRSEYLLDQGYQLQWFDPEHGVEMVSKNGPSFGIAFSKGGRVTYQLAKLYSEPVITVSYSDLVRYHYCPYPELTVDVTFVVYSSHWSFATVKLTNTGNKLLETGVHPYLYYSTNDSMVAIMPTGTSNLYTFGLESSRDGWMVEHNIPLVEKRRGYFYSSLSYDSANAFLEKGGLQREGLTGGVFGPLKNSFTAVKPGKVIQGFIGSRTIRLEPGESTSFRVMVGLERWNLPGGSPSKTIQMLAKQDVELLIKEDEKAYASIPQLKFKDVDREMFYWSSFSLMRQCMMPPEGKCTKNYYVFSREPVWGWGYGGEVFHESLTMLAYAYMDPVGAMNSQRVYMERQSPDGYINYRTGPYLDETIVTNGKKTTSALWYNYENLEIFKITGDRRFLEEAYESGQRFYQYYVAHRDSNSNGLCEWGGHAELESVRDARVAIWDEVGWASNFEGPDVNAMLVREARALEEMATLLGRKEEAARWRTDASQRSKLIYETLWDPQTGFYYNVDRNNHTFSYRERDDLKVKEIIGFLPLWAGVGDSLRNRLLVEKMLDTAEFWRPFGIPSLSAKSNYYCPIGYWNGPVWIQWNYLLFRGLLDQGYRNEAVALSDKVVDNMIYFLKKDHVFWEFYSPDERHAGWNKTYIWAGLASRFFIDLAQ